MVRWGDDGTDTWVKAGAGTLLEGQGYGQGPPSLTAALLPRYVGFKIFMQLHHDLPGTFLQPQREITSI